MSIDSEPNRSIVLARRALRSSWNSPAVASRGEKLKTIRRTEKSGRGTIFLQTLLGLTSDPLVNVRQFTLLEVGLKADSFRCLGDLFVGLCGQVSLAKG